MDATQKPDPVALVKGLLRASKPKREEIPFETKDRAMKAAALSGVSLATTTIVTRDRVEAEMGARRRADMNRMVSDQVAANAAASPETLDG